MIITQEETPHHPNQLHDELVAAGLSPYPVSIYEDRTEFGLSEADEEAALQVVAAHVPREPEPQPTTADVIAALASMELEGVTTVAGLKQAITPIRDAAAALIAAES